GTSRAAGSVARAAASASRARKRIRSVGARLTRWRWMRRCRSRWYLRSSRYRAPRRADVGVVVPADGTVGGAPTAQPVLTPSRVLVEPRSAATRSSGTDFGTNEVGGVGRPCQTLETFRLLAAPIGPVNVDPPCPMRDSGFKPSILVSAVVDRALILDL